jgi:type IV conjugative transfer system lipoprotein TraV
MKGIFKKMCSLMVAGLILSGCAGTNGNFSCQAVSGGGCTPVSQINDKANAGVFKEEAMSREVSGLSSTQTFQTTSNQSGYHGVTPAAGEPVRAGERIQRIWIAPYQDLANNYHEPSYLYIVLERPHWIGIPPKEIKSSETGQDD